MLSDWLQLWKGSVPAQSKAEMLEFFELLFKLQEEKQAATLWLLPVLLSELRYLPADNGHHRKMIGRKATVVGIRKNAVFPDLNILTYKNMVDDPVRTF
ncbi:hypothetical protein SAMN04488057_102332 [Cyclobacterium lianum]|uniref:Uncharacterized protein n=1 Tax=Cyclobacterium lianum TaxID=388280 RepID=A0A1M7K7V5_9BACT|nr:hypothetical protein SAMN04488057_102332 [Cyclobacterium lianum]